MRIVILITSLLLLSLPLAAQKLTANSTSTMSLEQNLSKPGVPAKSNAAVARSMENVRKKYAEKGFDTQAVRHNEVIKITVPVDRLFGPNETSLLPEADATLAYFKQAVERGDAYRLVVAVYADDTADADYTLKLTADRAAAIRRALTYLGNGQKNLNIDYYWFGPENFVAPNNTIANRAKNRRVEFYIIPEKLVIDGSRQN